MECIFEAMPSAGLPPDRNTLYIMMRAYVNSGHVDKAAALAERFKESGVQFKPTGERLLQLAVAGSSDSSSSSDGNGNGCSSSGGGGGGSSCEQ
jgi:pentatricopeptide repeat protein